MNNKSFEYDPFQKQAIRHIDDGHSVLVSAPTGAGKTAIAEYVIEDCIRRGKKVIYTAPIKALSNQKYREFQVDGEERAGIMTGDITLNPQAPVLIMTTEIFRNKLLERKESLDSYAWVIFDEIHYLDDYERGSVWEESLIFLPDHMNVLGLSATIPNIEDLQLWLQSIHHRPIKVVKEDHRPVPLHVFFQCQGKVYDDHARLIREGYSSPEFRSSRDRKLPRFVPIKPNRTTLLIKDLYKQDLLPCIYFVFSRRRTKELAQEVMVYDFLSSQDSRDILALYDRLCQHFDLAHEPTAHELRPLVARGIAYHHAGMLPTLKEVVERLFTSRMLKVIFTTETFALGINMPARTVIFDELRKFYGRSFATLRTRDFYQMAGRAGRRSIDTEGHVFCRVNPHYIAPSELRRVIEGKPERIQSQFNTSYATVLNLYKNYGEQLYDIYPKSLHYFQAGRGMQKKALQLMRGKVDILKELGYIRRNKLTGKGEFACNVYGYELILSELFQSGILDSLPLTHLGILMAAVVYEPRKGMTPPELTGPIKTIQDKAKKIMRKIQRLERTVGLRELSKGCAFHLTPAVVSWIKQGTFHEMLKSTDADEGEVIRYFRMTIQLLREVCQGPISDSLREKLDKLIYLMNRDIIDSEKQLRMSVPE